MKKRQRSQPTKQTARRRPASNKQALAIIPPHATVPFSTFGTFSETGWTPPKDMTYAQWKAHGKLLFHGIHSGVQWWIADFWAYGEHAYGDRIQALRDGFFGEYTYCTVATYASVARAFEPSTRVQDLSFTHHRHVASLPPEERAEWLARAARERWSTDDLYFAIHPDKRARRIEAPAAPEGGAERTTEGTAPPATDQIKPDKPRAVVDVHQGDRPAREMNDDERWRLNLNQAGHCLLHIPHTPITTYLHPDVHYTAEQWDQIAEFLNNLAAAMRNTVAALDEAAK
jgi:hypothetical protein